MTEPQDSPTLLRKGRKGFRAGTAVDNAEKTLARPHHARHGRHRAKGVVRPKPDDPVEHHAARLCHIAGPTFMDGSTR